MMPTCVPVAEICVSPAYQLVTELSGTTWMAVDKNGRPVHPKDEDVARLGAHISVVMSDNIHTEPTTGLTVGPVVGGSRIYYTKTCAADHWRCEYRWGAAAADQQSTAVYLGPYLTIEGRCANGLARAQQNLWLVMGGRSDRAYVPISELASETAAPPRAGIPRSR